MLGHTFHHAAPTSGLQRLLQNFTAGGEQLVTAGTDPDVTGAWTRSSPPRSLARMSPILNLQSEDTWMELMTK